MKEIPLTRGHVALVDDADYEYLAQFHWQVAIKRAGLYAYGREPVGKRRWTMMHRVIMGVTDRLVVVDHIDHNGLNNQRSNLRCLTTSQNQMNKRVYKNNKHGVTGVYWNARNKKWYAHIMVQRKQIRLGCFVNMQDAVNARREAEIKHFGEYAYRADAGRNHVSQ